MLSALETAQAFSTESAGRGQGVIYLIEDGRALAAFAVADAVRPESAEAVRQLHRQGLQVVMLTGDSRPVAEAVGRELGIDTVFAQVLPEEKVQKVQELQRQGRRAGGRGRASTAQDDDRGRDRRRPPADPLERGRRRA